MKPLIAIILLFQTVTLKAQKDYVIEGHIKGIEDNTEISLLRNDGNILSDIAKDTIIAGKFKFSGKTESPTNLAIVSRTPGFPSQWLDIYVTPSARIKITGSNKLLKTWTVESPVKDQIELSRYTKATRNELDKLQELSISRNTIFSSMRKASADERKKFKPVIDSIDKMTDSVNSLVYKKDILLLEKSSITPVWMNKLKNIAMDVQYNKKSVFREQAVTLFNRMNSIQKASPEGQAIQVFLFPPRTIKAGDGVPDNALADLEENKHYLSDYKGKYLLLDFWSIGCGPCIMAMPELEKLATAHKDSLTVISLSVDIKKELWKKATESHKISWVNLSDGKGMAGIAAQFGVNGIPHYALISPEGKFLTSWVGFSEGDLEKRIKKIVH